MRDERACRRSSAKPRHQQKDRRQAVERPASAKLAEERKSFYQDIISNIDLDNTISLGGGVSALRCESVGGTDGRLAVKATATVWAIIESFDQSGNALFGNPSSDMNVVAAVDSSNRLTSFSVDFAEGFHP